jgi:hypothetical protein
MIVNEEGLLLALPENPSCPGSAGNVMLGKREGSEVVGLNDSEVDVLQSGFAASPIIPLTPTKGREKKSYSLVTSSCAQFSTRTRSNLPTTFSSL